VPHHQGLTPRPNPDPALPVLEDWLPPLSRTERIRGDCVTAPFYSRAGTAQVRIRESLENAQPRCTDRHAPIEHPLPVQSRRQRGDFRHSRDAVHLLLTSAITRLCARCRHRHRVPGASLWDVPASYEEALISCLAEIGVTTGWVRGRARDGRSL
jgi:hypothetical protein